MASKLALDPRVDPRIKAVFATFELPTPTSVASREEILADEATESTTAKAAGMKTFLDAMDTELIAPSTGLSGRMTGYYPASTTFMAAGWRRCPATTAITVPGAG